MPGHIILSTTHSSQLSCPIRREHLETASVAFGTGAPSEVWTIDQLREAQSKGNGFVLVMENVGQLEWPSAEFVPCECGNGYMLNLGPTPLNSPNRPERDNKMPATNGQEPVDQIDTERVADIARKFLEDKGTTAITDWTPTDFDQLQVAMHNSIMRDYPELDSNLQFHIQMAMRGKPTDPLEVEVVILRQVGKVHLTV